MSKDEIRETVVDFGKAARNAMNAGFDGVAESKRALRLEEKGYPPVYYLPRSDTDMSLLERTEHYTYCPYKGDCTYYNIPAGGAKSENAVWTYERPHEAVADIQQYLAFYPSRVDAIEVAS
jgi:uncharacterized protein (DUF427 family)